MADSKMQDKPTTPTTTPATKETKKQQEPTAEEKPAALNKRLALLVRAAPVMVFIKGTAEKPFCGFSNELIQILKEEKVQFGYFDVFSDPEVRQGLKTFSNWNTFPQLYVHGELKGGLDVIKELRADDELAEIWPASAKVQSLDDRIRDIIASAPVVLFMKGVPAAPQCGFSQQIVGMLNKQRIKYATFNILEDNAVRQGIKVYSKFPTFPQLYVNNQLIGGLDICKELEADDELAELWPESVKLGDKQQ
jgi:Grx4 family monothiol glutaredoxin